MARVLQVLHRAGPDATIADVASICRYIYDINYYITQEYHQNNISN